MQEPETIQRVGRIRGIEHEQARHLTKIKQSTVKLFKVEILSRQLYIGAQVLLLILSMQLQNTCDTLRYMARRIATHTIFQVIYICTRQACSLRKLSL